MTTRVTRNRAWAIVLMVFLAELTGCASWNHSLLKLGRGMEYDARDRYTQALRYMEADRFELAQEEFAIVKRTADSPKLYELACEGYDKASAVIESRR